MIGPVVFELQLVGPGTGGIDADSILASFSRNAPAHEANAAVKFQAAGVGGEESGFVGSSDLCRTAVYIVGEPRIGETIDLCVTGGTGCHVCIWVSEIPGPFATPFGVIPVGLPILLNLGLGNLGLAGIGNPACIPVSIPNEPGLISYTLYLTNLTYFAPMPTGLSFSPAYTLTILG